MNQRFFVNVGDKNGRLTVLRFSHKNRHGTFWVCRCTCGTEKIIGNANFRRTTSCGCYRKEMVHSIRWRHGVTSHEKPHEDWYIYMLWSGIKRRCYNPNDRSYERYGARGIKIADEWKDNFEAFRDYILKEIGHRPTTKHSMDRINPNGNYCPGNIRWADKTQQARNRRNSFTLKWGTGKVTLADFCQKFGLNYKRVYAFLNDPLVRDKIE